MKKCLDLQLSFAGRLFLSPATLRRDKAVHRAASHFLNIARGSLCELQTQLEIARRAGLAGKEQLNSAALLSHEVGKLLYLLAQSIRTAPKKT